MIRTLAVVFGLLVTSSAAGQVILPPAPTVNAEAWILMDATTGHVITEHNADERLPPASLTKLMTSYVLAVEIAAGRVSNDDLVPISENAWAQNPVFAGSSLMWLEPDTQVPLEDLHRGVVVSSGNDATVAVAEYLAGSEDAFADMMNRHAGALGMNDTYYVNSHGLDASEHYTTARDLATLARALIRDFPEEYALYSERAYTYNNITTYNRNELLAEDPTVDGLKTGYTTAAGYCLVASAERQGMRLISVVLGADSKTGRKAESRKLLNHGFRSYETLALYSTGEELSESRVWQGQAESLRLGTQDAVTLTIPRGTRDKLQARVEVDEVIRAPVAEGAEYGRFKVILEGDALVDEPLVALESVEAAGFWRRLWDSIVLFFTQLFGA